MNSGVVTPVEEVGHAKPQYLRESWTWQNWVFRYLTVGLGVPFEVTLSAGSDEASKGSDEGMSFREAGEKGVGELGGY